MGIYKYDIIISKIIIVFVIETNIYVKYYLYRKIKLFLVFKYGSLMMKNIFAYNSLLLIYFYKNILIKKMQYNY